MGCKHIVKDVNTNTCKASHNWTPIHTGYICEPTCPLYEPTEVDLDKIKISWKKIKKVLIDFNNKNEYKLDIRLVATNIYDELLKAIERKVEKGERE